MNTLTNTLGSIEQTYASRIIPWRPRIIQKKSIFSVTKWAEWHMWIWFRPMVLSPSFLIFNQECRKVPCTFPRLHGCRMLEQWTCRFCLRFSIDWQISELFCCMISTSSLILNIYLINITAHFLETKKHVPSRYPIKNTSRITPMPFNDSTPPGHRLFITQILCIAQGSMHRILHLWDGMALRRPLNVGIFNFPNQETDTFVKKNGEVENVYVLYIL